jgi:pyridoxamine 5'-phosphate oxidase
MDNKDISQLRRDFNKGSFDIKNAHPNPFEQFAKWFEDARNSGSIEPNAMTLSTVSLDLKPSSRVLLLKSFSESGFIFYTNYDSRKGNELAANPNASLLFYWDILERQVRLEGIVRKISYEESEKYYKTRPYTSRLGAWVSKQSRVLSSRFSLMRDVAMLVAKYPVNVPLPEFWGGYILVPEYFEFWQGRESRLHDRICYHKDSTNWKIQRLYP